jgi:glycine dehydrogenase subunit 1
LADLPTIPHPFIADSVASAKREMLDRIGVDTIEELFEQVPADHVTRHSFQFPPRLAAEVDLRRHMVTTLARNGSCEEHLSFLGAGCWQHHVPGTCDEIVARREFLTQLLGTPASDHGQGQALFEWASQLGELLEVDFVGLPVYSWGCAAGFAIRMAARLTGRSEVLVTASLSPERRAVVEGMCQPIETRNHLGLTAVDYDHATGQLDLDDLARKLSPSVAAVYIETPTHLGVLEEHSADIATLVHGVGAILIVGADPISLGVLAPPSTFGADITVGPMQPLGVHMNGGGGEGGFIAMRDEESYVRQYPGMLLSMVGTSVPGERTYAHGLVEQTSYGLRDAGNDWTGHSVHLWAIANAVYLSLAGPEGMREVGELIVQRSHYAASRIAELEGLEVVFSGFFKEFVVNVDGTGKSVAEINDALLGHGIFGGKDLSSDFPELGQSALLAVTEVHTQHDIDRLVDALQEVTAP